MDVPPKPDAKLQPFETGCRFCGRTDTRLKRGLCSTHFSRFNRKFNKLALESSDKAKAFEDRCVEQGWILPLKEVGRPVLEDPFEKIVREVEAEFERDITAAVARDQAQQAKDDLKKRATKKPNSRKAN
jgi:hypothetical protein